MDKKITLKPYNRIEVRSEQFLFIVAIQRNNASQPVMC